MGRARVDVWWTDPGSATGAALAAAGEALLAAEELERCRGFRRAGRRREFLVSRALARLALSARFPPPPAAWRFRVDGRGRPEATPPGAARFNLTHCDGLVACAVAEGLRVGVDAEPRARGTNVRAIASRVFSPAELDALSALPDDEARDERAVALWTLKEAYVKALGVGMARPFPSLSFRVAGGRVALADASGEGEAWAFTSTLLGRHRVAVAVEAGSTSREPVVHLRPASDLPAATRAPCQS